MREIGVRLNQAVVKVLELPDVRQRPKSFNLEPVGSSADEMASHPKAELRKRAEVERDAMLEPGTIH